MGGVYYFSKGGVGVSYPPLSQKEAYRLLLKDYPDVLDIEQMCEVLNISMKTGYKLLREKKIESIKAGRSYRIPKLHLLTYLNIGVEDDNFST